MIELTKKVFSSECKDDIEAIRKYKIVYDTPEGRWVLENILKLCHYGDSCLGNSTDETYFKLGEHNIGLEIAQRITADIQKLEESSKKEEMTDDVQSNEDDY